jgi:hypothetical protein
VDSQHERLQFATLDSVVITIWEAVSNFEQPPIVVHSLLVPDNFDPSIPISFHPILVHLALSMVERVVVWDAQYSKVLLDSPDEVHTMAFSSTGHFFAYSTYLIISLWKVSPTGYTPHQQIVSNFPFLNPLLFSPNGESIVIWANDVLQLFHTKVPTTSPFSFSKPGTVEQQLKRRFLLEFSPGEDFTAVSRSQSEIVTVFDLKLGVPQLTINVGMEVYAVRVVGNTVFVVCPGKILTWSVPRGDGITDCRVDISHCTQETTLQHKGVLSAALISPDSHHLAISSDSKLGIYKTATGKCLKRPQHVASGTWLTLDGSKIRWSNRGSIEGTKQDEESTFVCWDHGNLTWDGVFGSTEDPSEEYPWRSTYGYKLINSGWILSPSGKQLLWAPYCWRLDKYGKKRWLGHYLALLHEELPEAIILDLQPE